MTGKRHIWTGTDLQVFIFLEDDNGIPLYMSNPNQYKEGDTPLLDYCFWQRTVITRDTIAQRRPSTGKPNLTILAESAIYVCRIDHFYFNPDEFDQLLIFNRERRMTIVMRFYDPTMYGSSSFDDQHILKHSVAKSFDLDTAENGNSISDVQFWAEDYVFTPVQNN